MYLENKYVIFFLKHYVSVSKLASYYTITFAKFFTDLKLMRMYNALLYLSTS